MNYAMLDTYMNMFLLATVVGAILYAVYHVSRKKAPPPREAPKRPEGYRPKVKQEESDEAFHPSPLQRSDVPTGEGEIDWKEMPARSPMHDAIVKPPAFRPRAPKAPVMHKLSDSRPMTSHKPKSYKADSAD